MGFKKAWKQSIQQLGADLQKDKKAVLQNKDPVSVHQFRVRMKQYRACYHCLTYISGESTRKRTWEVWRAVFKKSSVTRDLQVLLDAPDLDNQHAATLKQHLGASADQFYKALKARSETAFNKLTEDLCAQINTYSTRTFRILLHAYIMNRFVRIKHHKLLLPNDRKLHRIRREIKELAYLFNIWAKADPTAEEIKLMYQQLIQKQELIGNWHDQLNKLDAVKDLNVTPTFLEEQQQLQSQLKQQAITCLDDLGGLVEEFEGMRM